MPRTNIPVQTPLGPFPALPVAANALDITVQAADVANLNEFVFTGKELILVKNDDAGAQTITLTSVADEQKRTGDITTYSVGIGEYAAFLATSLKGWQQSDGKFYLAASSANIKIAVLRLP
jgi:hypothetical protein